MIVRSEQKSVDVLVSGRVHQPLFGSSHFEFNVWHQFPGDLKQGSLAVWVKSKAVPTGEQFQRHSFETWSPNEVKALSFQFPLGDFQPDSILTVECLVQATNAKTTSSRFVWQKDRWIH